LGGTPLTIASPMKTSPLLTLSSPAIMRSMVDFPPPDGPSTTMSSPSFTCSVTSSTAVTLP
jgi:hypothetical protein